MRARTAVVALDHDPSAGSERLRPPGEEAPLWLAPTLAVLGTVLSVWVSGEIFGEGDVPPTVLVEARPLASEGAEPSTTPTAPAASPAPAAAANVAPVVAASGEGEGKASGVAVADPSVPPPIASVPPSPLAATTPPAPGAVAPMASPVDVAPVRPLEAALAPAVAQAPVPSPCLPMVGIPFTHDSTKPLVDGLEPAVRPLLGWLAEHPAAVLSVEGHADTIGTEDYNIVLSFGRARATIAWLVRLGAAQTQLAPRAAGTSAPKTLPSGMASNRLVILQIEGVEACRDIGGAAKKP